MGSRLHDISEVIKQSMAASKLCPSHTYTSTLSKVSIQKYSDLGISRLLYLIAAHPETEGFARSVISVLQEYDEATNSQIYDTMLSFHANDHNYKKTATSIFVHENTVRYRINKAKELIESVSSVDDFKETFSIALKCKKIIEK